MNIEFVVKKICVILYVRPVQYMQCNRLICRERFSRKNVIHYQIECGKRHLAVTYLHGVGLLIKYLRLQSLS